MSPAADDSAATQTPSKKSRVSLDTARSHHRKSVCPVCGKEGTNLKGHLNSHARKRHIKTLQVEKLFSVTVKDKDARGQGRRTNSCKLTGLPVKWCPVEGCETVTHLLRSHLTDTPHIKPSALLENYLHVVRSYRGQKEVEDRMQSIELARRSSQPTTHVSHLRIEKNCFICQTTTINNSYVYIQHIRNSHSLHIPRHFHGGHQG